MKHYDLVIIGAGTTGRSAAIEAAKAGRSVALVERERQAGGVSLHRRDIPAMILRAMAPDKDLYQRRHQSSPPKLEIRDIRERVAAVVKTHAEAIDVELERHKIERYHAQARFKDDKTLTLDRPTGGSLEVSADFFVLATGSRPRPPHGFDLDHEHVVDSDSLLALDYLPQRLAVQGSGVIACEYASIFLNLGVQVSIFDRASVLLPDLDPEMRQEFLRAFERNGGQFYPDSQVDVFEADEIRGVRIQLTQGVQIESDKLLVAHGRVANSEQLGLDAAGVELSPTGLVAINEHHQSSAAHIYAVGGVANAQLAGPTSIGHAREAVRHALEIETLRTTTTAPSCYYTIPEIAQVGLREAEATARYGQIKVGRSALATTLCGQIKNREAGVLKLIADARGHKLLGVCILGEGAAELIHIGQLALQNGSTVRQLAQTLFDLPTLAEAYRSAALEILRDLPVEQAA